MKLSTGRSARSAASGSTRVTRSFCMRMATGSTRSAAMDTETFARAATYFRDKDSCRPEKEITPRQIAETILAAHWDMAMCFCGPCVIARELKRLQDCLMEAVGAAPGTEAGT